MSRKGDMELSNLPRKTNGEINWTKCSGLKVVFKYSDKKGVIEIIK